MSTKVLVIDSNKSNHEEYQRNFGFWQFKQEWLRRGFEEIELIPVFTLESAREVLAKYTDISMVFIACAVCKDQGFYKKWITGGCSLYYNTAEFVKEIRSRFYGKIWGLTECGFTGLSYQEDLRKAGCDCVGFRMGCEDNVLYIAKYYGLDQFRNGSIKFSNRKKE